VSPLRGTPRWWCDPLAFDRIDCGVRFGGLECPASAIRSAPNRANAPECIVRLVGQVVRVNVETVEIVNGLPAMFGGGE
jgi:hypothetical protein